MCASQPKDIYGLFYAKNEGYPHNLQVICFLDLDKYSQGHHFNLLDG